MSDPTFEMSGAFDGLAPTECSARPGVREVWRPTVWFLRSTGTLLGAVAIAKAFSATGSARALDVTDPLFGLAFRHLLLVVGLVELLVAFFCLFTARRSFSLAAVAWLASNFLIYRAGLWLVGWHHPCGCMGSLAGLLHLSDHAADNVMKGVLVYMLIGSYLLLIVERRRAWLSRKACLHA